MRARWKALFLPALLVSTPSLGGPNAGGVLIVHDTGFYDTCEQSTPPTPPPACRDVDNMFPAASAWNFCRYWKVYAAFPEGSRPRLRGVSFGANFGSEIVVLDGGVPLPGTDGEARTFGWPNAPGSGVSVSFGCTRTAGMVECYWLAGYGYAGQWCLAPHPTASTDFLDDAEPARADPIADLGSLGFGEPGYTPCPRTAGLADGGPVYVFGVSWGRVKEGFAKSRPHGSAGR